MAFINRYSAIDKAIIVATGNSLVLCGEDTQIQINTSDMITPNNTVTRDWNLAGSTAQLDILSGSTILYAELIWYSTVNSSNPIATDVRSIANSAITLITPTGNTIDVSPQTTQDYTAASGSVERFREANVTNIIQNNLGGNYTVQKVPTSIPETGLSDTRAGWSLVVIYRHESFLPKRISFSSGINYIDEYTPLQTTITGFSTMQEESSLGGHLYLMCANASPLVGGESLQAGPSYANLRVMGNAIGIGNTNPGTAPNNPYNNIFAGQINTCNALSSNMGLIDIAGTRGSNNHNAFVPLQVIGARNKWDMTMLDLKPVLTTSQNQLALQYTQSTSSGEVEVLGIGAQISALAPNITSTLKCCELNGKSIQDIEVGEQIVYVTQLKNLGSTVATNVILSTVLDSSCSFVPNSLEINGVVSQGADITQGINIGSLDPTAVVNVYFRIRINNLPISKTINAKVNYQYSFLSGTGSPTYTNYASTKSIDIDVYAGKISVTKSVSSVTTSIGGDLTYTVAINNTGTQTATGILFRDPINAYCSFTPYSVEIDGVAYPDYNPNNGFSLEDLLPGDNTVITFDITVNNLPPTALIKNAAFVTFSYFYDGYNYSTTNTTSSNITSVQVQYSEVIGKRTNNNNYPNKGDIVTYTLALTNIGNVPATNVQVQEPEILGASFVTGSVKINSVSKPMLNPFTGFTLESPIPSQNTTTITYDVLINEVQPSQVIENIAQVPFKYQITPGGPVIDAEKDSNKVVTRSNFVVITIPETVDKAYATINDVLYYSVNLTNTGNIDAFNTLFSSAIQSNAQFIPGSVAINGIAQPSYNPNMGFSIGSIAPGNTINVTYSATVLTVPNPNIIYNNSQLVYSYLPNPTGNPITTTTSSNTVQTVINQMNFNILKTVDKAYAQVEDYLVYTTRITNTGTVTLTNVKFNDTVPTYLSFMPGTVYVDGVAYPDYNPNNGFPVVDIHPTETLRVVFGVRIIAPPPTGYVINISQMSYTYQVNPGSPIITETAYSNEARTQISEGNLVVTKSVDKNYAVIGDTLTYNLNLSNTGNVAINNAYFVDTLANAISFVPGSVSINGISKPNYNPNTGFNVGTVQVGQVIAVQFKVTVNSLPTPNTVNNSASVNFEYYSNPQDPVITKTVTSNTVTTVVNQSTTSLTKQVDKTYATIGDTLTYTITAQNTGTVEIANVSFMDIIAQGANFITDSVKIDGISKPGYNPNTGFALSNIAAGGSSVISFKVNITSLPNPPQINNTANMTYQYRLSPTSSYITASVTSNTVTTQINKSTVTNTKEVDKAYATVGDRLTYTSTIVNTGNVDSTNMYFTDILVPGLTFTQGTVKINGTLEATFDPNVGFSIGTLSAGEMVTVEFKADITASTVIPYVQNNSKVQYEYKISPTGETFIAAVTSNTVTTIVNIGNLTIVKTANREYARLTDVVEYSFVITNIGNTVLTNVSFQDAVQVESSFNVDSVYVNGVNEPGLNPNTGFTLGEIGIGHHVTVSFSVTVNSIPTGGILYNTGNATYTYVVNPSESPIVKNKVSNQTMVNVNDTIVSITKAVDKNIAKVGDTLNFSFNLSNAGNVAAQSINFKDILDTHIQFNTGSVVINGTTESGYDPNVGFLLPDLAANTTMTVSFAATIMTRPQDNIIYNHATINYEYTPDPNKPPISAIMMTNITQTYVAVAELTLSKVVDKVYGTVGDTLTYTVEVMNTGSVNATNVNFLDTIATETSFKPGTVIIDGISQPTYDPIQGFMLDNLLPLEITIVSFKVQVNTLPISGKVQNRAEASFNYQLTPQDPVQTKTNYSNTVTTYINLGVLYLTKTVDKAYATIGNHLTYTITAKNTGNVTCLGVFFQDVVQQDVSFDLGTVVINQVAKPDYNPNTGFVLNNIIAGETTTISFTVTVNTVPVGSMVYNTARTDYSYFINPNEPSITTSSYSNTVQTQINLSKVEVIKQTNKAYATLGETVTFTISVTNSGNINAKTVNFRDVVPTGLTFVPHSVTINSTPMPDYDPYESFTLGTIVPGGSVVVKFDVTVTSIPTPSLVQNTAQITYGYRINPTLPDIITEMNSNTVTVQLNFAQITSTKQVDKSYATKGELLTYTVTLKNTGNINVTGVVFSDGLQSDVSFNTGSVIVNGYSQPTYDPTIGFDLGDIAPLDSVIVSFTVTVVDKPINSTVINFSLATYSYKIDPMGATYSRSSQSNTVYTTIIMGSMESTKVVNLAYATLLDTLVYTILVKNTGNAVNKNLFFIDTLSNGVTFNVGSVKINNVSEPSLNPITGFSLPQLVAGDVHQIEFTVQVTSIPVPSQVTNYAITTGTYKVDPVGPDYQLTATSNTVSTQINVGMLSNVKTVDKGYANVGDNLTYTNVITNTGNVNATNIQFFDTLQSEVSYVTGTVKINGVTNPNLNPTTGFLIGTLAPGQNVTVEFSVKINSLPVLPQVDNISQVQFSYYINPNASIITKTQFSNTVTTYVVLGMLNVNKVVDKGIATIGDELNYTVTVTNAGNTVARNAFFQDIPSEGAIFKIGSVTINGISQGSYDPTVGFSLGDIGIGNVVTVTFIATVVSVPSSNKVTNQAVINFEYTVDPKQPVVAKTAYSNIVTTNIVLGNLTVVKSVDKAFATIGEYLTYTIVITNVGNINATNVIFVDPTPLNSVFKLGSVSVNGTSEPTYHPSVGFPLNTLLPGEIVTVIYQVQVVS